jgi:hypothetical protein
MSGRRRAARCGWPASRPTGERHRGIPKCRPWMMRREDGGKTASSRAPTAPERRRWVPGAHWAAVRGRDEERGTVVVKTASLSEVEIAIAPEIAAGGPEPGTAGRRQQSKRPFGQRGQEATSGCDADADEMPMPTSAGCRRWRWRCAGAATAGAAQLRCALFYDAGGCKGSLSLISHRSCPHAPTDTRRDASPQGLMMA